jgi:hypothetical protein
MSVLPSTPIPAGWYPDPAGSFQQRWWNGTSWTNDFAQYRPTLIHSAPLAEAIQSGAEQPGFGEFATKQAAGAKRSAGSQTTGSTSTITRGTRSGDDAAVFGLPPEDRAPLTSVARPNAGNAVLVPVVPVSTTPSIPEKSQAWANYQSAAQSSSAPSTQQSPSTAPAVAPLTESRRKPHVGPTRRYTAAAWLLALLPALFVASAVAVATYLPTLYSTVALLVLGAAFLLFGVLIAAADRRVLFVNDHEFTASPAWSLLTPLSYLSVRATTVSRETGRGAVAPLILLLVTVAGIVASLILVSGLLTLLTPTTLY